MAKRNRNQKAGQLAVVSRAKGLGPAQQTALMSLRAGHSMEETARQAGVARMTVHRWVHENAEFQAAYNQMQQAIVQACRARLLMMTGRAAETVEAALNNGDARIAVQLLKGLGMLRARKGRPVIDAQELRRRRSVREQRREAKLARAERGVDLDVRRWKMIDDGLDKAMAEHEKPRDPARVAQTTLRLSD